MLMTKTDSHHPQDVRHFLAGYAAAHPEDVIEIDSEVSDDQDATALIWALAAQGRQPLLRLNRVAHLQSPVLCNVFGSRQRIARLFDTDEPGLHAAYQKRSRAAMPSKVVDHGPVLEQVISGADVDLNLLPMLKHFETDRKKYITSGIILGEDPDTGIGNLSYHRAMIHSKNQLATSLHSRGHLWRLLNMSKELGRPMPVAMIIGGHPLFMLAASARLAFEEDERDIAGGLMGAPLEVVETPKYGIRVPAHAEIVLEGVIDHEASVEEGPFGEFTGYSSDRSTNNLFTVETILRRNAPILGQRGRWQFRRTPEPWPHPARGGDGREAAGALPVGDGGALPVLGHAFPRLCGDEPKPRRRGPAGHAGAAGMGPVPEDRDRRGCGCGHHPRRRGALGAVQPFPAASGRGDHRGAAGQCARPLGQRHRHHVADGAGRDARAGFPRHPRADRRRGASARGGASEGYWPVICPWHGRN
ncbi:UbiD family decarboxylase domain-containing protein [Ponticoccus litoralis]|uniref:UbiD family decarboxylase domain-containing protein n=1 Tax=Ponticoccus litoralis TaxID=422297 RepID=A0AAW9SGP0_9RHOB